MVNKLKLEHRAVPYIMLKDILTNTTELVEGILPKSAMPSLKLGAKKISSVLATNLEKVGDGLPIVGYHFSFPAEFLTCFDCVPVCIEGISYYLAALLLHGSEKYYDKMNNWGHPFHTCTSQKS